MPKLFAALPGVAGALAVSVGAAALTDRPSVGVIVLGLFGLALDRRL